ncbi:hypothetical protein I4U23_016630 [Adineta vaga]|nr:hypothetical protein I4U23_016630 [Adineta vaga]
MSTFIHWLRSQISTLNLFENELSRSNQFHLRTSIIATRLYIILFTVAIIFLTIYTGLSNQTYIITKNDITQTIYEELFEKYSTTLTCPCRHTAISYDKFLSIIPEYHPICSSIFISNIWINHIFNSNLSYFIPNDFRSSSSSHFQILATFCSYVQRLINETLVDILSDIFISTYIVDSKILTKRSEILTIFAQTSITNDMRRSLRLVRNNIQENQMLSALQTSIVNILYNFWRDYVMITPTTTTFLNIDGQLCQCDKKSTCLSPSGFFDLFAEDTHGNYTPRKPSKFNITGFFVGCWPIESLLQSTLECFFDKICLENILQYFPPPSFPINTLKFINESHYTPHSSIETLVNQLFIEHFSTRSSFSAYFSQCQPISCVYTYSSGNSISYIFTTLLGLYGGLTVILRMLVPRIIAWIRGCKLIQNEPNNNTIVPLFERLQLIWQKIFIQIREFNLFDNTIIRQDPFKLRTTIISTRIYFILLTLFVTILVIFTATRTHLQTFNVYYPTYITFENLYEKYSSTLRCPCNQITIPYGSFVSISPQYHPVCSSFFIGKTWITFLLDAQYSSGASYYQDFRIAAIISFNILSTFCSLIQTTVADAWFSFNQSTLITLETLSRSELLARTWIILKTFQSNTVANFKRLVTLNELHTRTMFPSLEITTVMSTPDRLNSSTRMKFYPVTATWEGCSCALTEYCLYKIYLYEYGVSEQPVFTVPDFWLGCTATQGILGSSLECFFNQTCTDRILSEISPNNSIIIRALSMNDTKFPPNTSVSTFINELVEEWIENINYTDYYTQCSPNICSYTLLIRNNVLYILTTIVALLGGISVVLKFIVPIFIDWLRNRIHGINQLQIQEQSKLFRNIKS